MRLRIFCAILISCAWAVAADNVEVKKPVTSILQVVEQVPAALRARERATWSEAELHAVNRVLFEKFNLRPADLTGTVAGVFEGRGAVHFVTEIGTIGGIRARAGFYLASQPGDAASKVKAGDVVVIKGKTGFAGFQKLPEGWVLTISCFECQLMENKGKASE